MSAIIKKCPKCREELAVDSPRCDNCEYIFEEDGSSKDSGLQRATTTQIGVTSGGPFFFSQQEAPSLAESVADTSADDPNTDT